MSRYVINYNAGKTAGTRVFVNTDKRYRQARTIAGATFGATIDRRTYRRKPARQLKRTDMRKRWLLLAVIVFALFYFMPRESISQAPKPTETPAQTDEAIPPSWQFPAVYESADPPAGWNEEETAQAQQPSAPAGDLYDKYFGSEAKLARAICTAENGTQQPDRVSKPNRDKSVDVGLCQINSKAHADKATIEQLKDPETNIRIAKQIRDSWQSWKAWTCYNSGAYKKHL